MQLAKDVLTESVTNEQIYFTDFKTNVSLIYLNNESDSGMQINLYIQYGSVTIRISKKNQLLNAGETLVINTPFELNPYDIIRITTSAAGLSYIIQGSVITQPIEDIITANVLENVVNNFDTRYMSINTTGLTRVSTGSPFQAQTFFNTYFDFDESDLSFTDCNFTGTCFIKNAGGSVTFSGTCRGGFVICSDKIQSTMIGFDEVDTNKFP